MKFRRNKKVEVTVKYELVLGYCCGMLATSHFYDTLEEAKAQAEFYKTHFLEPDAFYCITEFGEEIKKIEYWNAE